MPYGINILFATDFDWWSLLAGLVQLVISFGAWFPFVFLGPKYQLKVEEAEKKKKEEERALRLAAKEKLASEQTIHAAN